MNIITVVGIIIGSLYFVVLINHILYLRKIYFMDLHNLKQQKKSEIATIQTKMIKEGTMRYASQTAKGIIIEVERVANERIKRRRLKYRHDFINSSVTAITSIFGK